MKNHSSLQIFRQDKSETNDTNFRSPRRPVSPSPRLSVSPRHPFAVSLLLPLAALLLLFLAGSALAQLQPTPSGVTQQGLPGPLHDVGIDQRLDQKVPLDLVFRDEAGAPVRLGEYFGSKPVILTLVYYECPMLCNQVLNGLDRGLTVLSFDVGNQFNIVTVSFNPRETPELAASKKEAYIRAYQRPGASAGWHFLTGDEAAIQSLTSAVGFRYAYDPESKQYAHASGIMILTPDGKISRYFYGIEYGPKDLRLGIIEASEGRIGTPADKILLYCFHYDPATGKYSLMVLNVIRLGGIATLLAIAILLFVLRKKNRRARAITTRLEPWQLALLPLFPDQASSHAGKVDALYLFLVGISTIMTVAIFLFIIYFAVKYRRRSANEVGTSSEGDPRLEAAWIIIPFVIFMAIFVWGAKVFFALTTPPRDTMEVFVVGKQWMWKFQHIDGQREINELHVPVNRDVKLIMTTEDVIHSFFVPDFRIKGDVVPGRYSSIWFKPIKPGRYHLFCAEYCGTNHSGMIGWIYAMDPADYEAWLSGGPTEGSLASSGAKLFQQLGCATCHRSDAQGRGPVLNGLFGKSVQLVGGQTVIADESYLRTCITNPNTPPVRVAGFEPIMPNFQGLVSEEQLLQLIEYIKSLGPAQPGAASPGAPSGTAPPPAKPEATRTTPAKGETRP
jgi:cytochrome c oxidase subunit 2